MEIDIDLKWSLWSADPYHWDEMRADRALVEARKAFEGTSQEPVVLRTAPRKEIRYGKVTISKGQAEVEFHCVWDAAPDQVPTFVPADFHDEAVERIHDWFCNHLGYLDFDPDNPIGAEVKETVQASTFDELLKKVDACEERLLAAEKEASETFEKFLTGLKEGLGK